jgi:PAS domain S-box-containing protein
MEDVALQQLSEDVSCRNLTWIFELCSLKNIDARRIIRDTPHPIEYLKDPAGFITWRSYTSCASNIARYLEEEELMDAGRNSWKSGGLKIYSYVGRLLFSTRDQYLEMFGPLGVLASSYPLNTSVIQVEPKKIQIMLTMKPGRRSCYAFHSMLAGQMAGLPESLGHPSAEVQFDHSENGASFEISFKDRGGLLAPVRRAFMWMVTARATARELTRTYQSLLDKYLELQSETHKLNIAEQKLGDSDKRHRLITDNVNDIIWTMNLDQELIIQYINPAVFNITGYTDQEIINQSLHGFLAEESLNKVLELIEKENTVTASQDTPATVEIQLIHKSGHTLWLETRTSLVHERDKPVRLMGIARDVTERKLMEGAMDERKAQYQVITNTARDAIVTINRNNLITFANPASSHVFGFQISELIGMNATRLMPEALGEPILRDFFHNENCRPRTGVELKALRKDGSLVSLEMSFASYQLQGEIFRTCFIRDVSLRNETELERKQLEQQLQASQKIESIGQLTGGIAHDFNNLLVAILGYSDLALAAQLENPDIEKYLNEIKLAGERAADMTQKLLAFSRRQIIEPEPLNINRLISELDLMIDRLLPGNIDVVYSLADHDLTVLADSGQVEQVLVNLAVNARDAMPTGGILEFQSRLQTIDRDFVSQNTFAMEGNYVALKVTDNGTGMSKDTVKHIFEPFFTTKPEGAGTGLGLSVVFGIIKQHNGFIDINSEVGKGSAITVYLPVTHSKAKAIPASPTSKTSGGSETILIVEDNPQVRNLARLILKGAGYRVLEAEDGQHAMEVFSKYQEDIDLVISDVVMPRMGGREVMDHMRAINPLVKILFTSGYSASGIHTDFILKEGLEFVAKPYDTETLRTRVRAVLDDNLTEVFPLRQF